MAKVTDVVDTPNPDALKFMVDTRLVKSGARSFDDPAAGGSDPLASALFSLGPVASVFYMDRFVTVTKRPEADWNALQPRIIESIQAHARPADDAAAAQNPSAEAAASDSETLDKIHQVLDEMVRPALAGDGGGLEVLGYEDFILSVHYQGACGNCPSSTAGTLFSIQNLLQRMVDPRIQVAAV